VSHSGAELVKVKVKVVGYFLTQIVHRETWTLRAEFHVVKTITAILQFYHLPQNAVSRKIPVQCRKVSIMDVLTLHGLMAYRYMLMC